MIIESVQQPFNLTVTPVQREELKNNAAEIARRAEAEAEERAAKKAMLDRETQGKNIDITA